jgi:acyl-CoA synthetase (AMP-forming)/AMP-acid ligase II
MFRGNIVMKGYLKNPKATDEAFAGGWFHMGDVFVRNPDGTLDFVDRRKYLIKSGGENIYPAEIERVLVEHPALQDVAVIGVPDAQWGEVPKAVVVLKPGATLEPNELLAWCRERLGGYKVPRTVDVLTELPRNPTGKILKRELRKPYWEGRERQVV